MTNADPKNAELELAELLKRCSPATLEAAIRFRETKDAKEIEPIVMGVIKSLEVTQTISIATT